MNFDPINPYQVIKELQEENKELRIENEILKEMLDDGVDTSNLRQKTE